jgi:hypothetical protein
VKTVFHGPEAEDKQAALLAAIRTMAQDAARRLRSTQPTCGRTVFALGLLGEQQVAGVDQGIAVSWLSGG